MFDTRKVVPKSSASAARNMRDFCLFTCFVFFEPEQHIMCSPSWSGTNCVAQDDFELMEFFYLDLLKNAELADLSYQAWLRCMFLKQSHKFTGQM